MYCLPIKSKPTRVVAECLLAPAASSPSTFAMWISQIVFEGQGLAIACASLIPRTLSAISWCQARESWPSERAQPSNLRVKSRIVHTTDGVSRNTDHIRKISIRLGLRTKYAQACEDCSAWPCLADVSICSILSSSHVLNSLPYTIRRQASEAQTTAAPSIDKIKIVALYSR